MKRVFLITVLLSACQKDVVPVPVIISSINIDNMCFKDTGYKVLYSVKDLKEGELIFGGGAKGRDTLYKHRLPKQNGIDSFFIPTGQAECEVKLFVYILHLDSTKTISKQDGNCINCE